MDYITKLKPTAVKLKMPSAPKGKNQSKRLVRSELTNIPAADPISFYPTP